LGPWIWLWHWLPCYPIVWMVLELVGGIGAQYRAPLPHEGKSPPMIPRSPALYSPEITSLPFPDPRAYPFATRLEKKKRERATPERGDDDGGGDGRLIPLCMRYLLTSSPLHPRSHTSPTNLRHYPSLQVRLLASLIYFPFPLPAQILLIRSTPTLADSSLLLFPIPFRHLDRLRPSFLLPPSIHFRNPNPFSLYFAGYLCQVFVVLQFD